MGRLDAAQFADRRRICVGSHEIAVLKPGRGVLKIWGRLWYLRASKRIMVKIRIIPSKTNNGIKVSKTWEEDWAGGGTTAVLKSHLEAVVRKYHKLYRAREWPEEDNYLTKCNRRNKAGFVASVCATCSASYCTVER